MKAKVFILIAMAFGIAASCTKEEVKTTYSRQEKNIESFINFFEEIIILICIFRV